MEKFVFGTMRLHEVETQKAFSLLCTLLRNGVRRFHSSLEYDSFSIFCDMLPEACSACGISPLDIRHIVKLASPHFGENSVSEQSILGKVSEYQTRLSCNEIDLLQWMARADLAREDLRLSILDNQIDILSDLKQVMISNRSIRALGCFPYTVRFAEKAISTGLFDQVVDYWNPEDQKPMFYQSDLQSAEMKLTVLRPFGAGHSLTGKHTASSLYSILASNPNVDGIVVGTSSSAHVKQILDL